jgi:peptidoglycan hydrolase-like protein with peptidoglycan-binding domain
VLRRRALLLTALIAVAVPGTAAAARGAWHLGDRPLRLGTSGHDVRVLQDFLTRDGFPTGVDGSFGRATRTAVRHFQAAAGLTPSGTVGPKTVAALRRGAASAATAPAVVPTSAPTSTAMAGGVSATPTAPASTSAPMSSPATLSDGLATAPMDAPSAVAAAIEAGNRIAKLPYRYGGGHKSFDDTAYDCSGSVSYALHAAGLLANTKTSGELESFGESGPGSWITIYANADHVYAVIAGVRFDTSGQRQAGSRWQAAMRSGSGFVVRHPVGL